MVNAVSNMRTLIGNRGVIAHKAMRALRNLGVGRERGPVVVFTPTDTPHNNPFFIPWLANPQMYRWARPISEYTDVDALLGWAGTFDVDAFYPGFGFLAEEPSAALAFEKRGITWVGPSSDTLKLFGDKVRARELAVRLRVPVIPGTLEPVTAEDALVKAAEIGYPIRVKSVMAGGGRGQAVVDDPEELKSTVERISKESLSVTGDDRVFLERHLPRVRHLEVQIIGDGEKVLHMGARNCSIQIPGRHQKLMERAVYPEQKGLPLSERALLREIIKAAVKMGEAVLYRGVGTVEFLVDEDNNFYFLEVNPRIQVEHPVTEMVVRVKGQSIDLVEEQFRIASGMKLEYDQDDVAFVGDSLEARIISMDFDSLIPFPSDITWYRPPELVPGRVRLEDGGIDHVLSSSRVSYPVPLAYDPMFAQLIVWGEDRLRSIVQLRKSLGEYSMFGRVRTSIPFILEIAAKQQYIIGDTGIFTDFTNRLVA